MDFKFPDVGEGLMEGVLVKWLVAVGDTIQKDQPIAQVETDKAVVDIPCPNSGTISELLVNEGETIRVGKVILKLDESGAPLAKPPAQETESKETETEKTPVPEQPQEKPVEAPQSPSQQPVKVPQQVTAKATPSTKATKEILAMPNVKRFAKEHNLDLTITTASGKHNQITMDDVTQNAHEQPKIHAEETATVPQSTHEILATPSTRRLARELGVDLQTIQGSGSNGKITADDVQKAKSQPTQSQLESVQPVDVGAKQESKPQQQSEQTQQVTPRETPVPSPKTAQTIHPPVANQTIPLTPIRKVIAKRLVESQQHTASVTTTDEVDVADIFEIYKKEKEVLKDEVKLSFLAFITKATILALQKYPVFNGSLNEQTQEMHLHQNIHMGIAAATPRGLVVPVLFESQQMSIKTIAQQIRDVAIAARDGTLKPDKMSGSTFTISNIGSIGGQIFTPIINYPEVAILGVGKVIDKPAVVNNEIVPRKLMWLSLTFDHRVVDGADAAYFLNTIKEYLEDPQKLLVEM